MLAAEIWALGDGLKLPLQTNITNVEIKRDANNVIKLIHLGRQKRLSSIIHDCR